MKIIAIFGICLCMVSCTHKKQDPYSRIQTELKALYPHGLWNKNDIGIREFPNFGFNMFVMRYPGKTIILESSKSQNHYILANLKWDVAPNWIYHPEDNFEMQELSSFITEVYRDSLPSGSALDTIIETMMSYRAMTKAKIKALPESSLHEIADIIDANRSLIICNPQRENWSTQDVSNCDTLYRLHSRFLRSFYSNVRKPIDTYKTIYVKSYYCENSIVCLEVRCCSPSSQINTHVLFNYAVRMHVVPLPSKLVSQLSKITDEYRDVSTFYYGSGNLDRFDYIYNQTQ